MSKTMRTDYIERNISTGNMVKVEVKVHPGTNKKVIVINYPGYAGDIDWFHQKYAKLADHTAMRIGSTLRIAWADWIRWEDYEDTVAKQLDATIQFAIQNSQAIAWVDEKDLEINLMWFSAWASWIAIVCSKYPQVKKNTLDGTIRRRMRRAGERLIRGI